MNYQEDQIGTISRRSEEANSHANPLIDPRILDRFEILDELPQGGMGIVVRAREKALDRKVVLKFVRPELLSSPESREQFLAEARAVAKLDHPHVVKLHEFNAEFPYFSMEYLPGGDLAAYIWKQGPAPLDVVIPLVSQIAAALQQAHDLGQLHQDIKPSNIFLKRNDQNKVIAKVGDFGLALSLHDEGQLVTSSLKGTWDYMAPERLLGQPPTERSDQWSLAATCYTMLTGKSARIQLFDRSRIPAAVQATLLRALHDDPAERFESVIEFANALSLPIVTESSSGVVQLASAVTTDENSPILRLRKERQHVAAQHEQAREHIKVHHDYDSALALLGDIPEASRDAAFYKNVCDRANRLKELRELIENANAAYSERRLARHVVEYLELKPNDREILELRDELPALVRPTPLTAPFSPEQARQAQQQWADWLDCDVKFTNSIGMTFRIIPPGTFGMGAADNEEKRSSDESPQHRVRITRPFLLGGHPITQGEYKRIMNATPSYFDAASSETRWQLPVEQVSFEDALEFLKKLNALPSEPGRRYRLPWEAEWEYACRAGTTTPFWWGSELNGKQANCDGSNPYGTSTKGPYLQRTTPVGSYAANPFGLFDMGGNVWQWCGDWYGARYYEFSPAIDPTGPTAGSSRVLRGGSWYNSAVGCRSAYRSYGGPASRNKYNGFRVLCELS